MNRNGFFVAVLCAGLVAAAVGVVCEWIDAAYVARINSDLSYPPGPKLDGGPVPVPQPADDGR